MIIRHHFNKYKHQLFYHKFKNVQVRGEHTAIFARVAGGVRRKNADTLGGALKYHALLGILQKQPLHATENRRICG
jgi:hypothetical protein